MKAENWTGYTRPCFACVAADPFDMTKDQFIDELENETDDCDCFVCKHKVESGGSWKDCKYGRMSKWCDWEVDND